MNSQQFQKIPTMLPHVGDQDQTRGGYSRGPHRALVTSSSAAIRRAIPRKMVQSQPPDNAKTETCAGWPWVYNSTVSSTPRSARSKKRSVRLHTAQIAATSGPATASGTWYVPYHCVIVLYEGGLLFLTNQTAQFTFNQEKDLQSCRQILIGSGTIRIDLQQGC